MSGSRSGVLYSLSRFDTALLGSDGLFDNLFVHEVVETLCAGALRGSVARLVAAAGARMQAGEAGVPCKPDDLTLVAFRLAPGLLRPRSPIE